MIHEWDPFQTPILAERRRQGEASATSSAGQTMEEQVDEFTGLSRKVIVEAKDPICGRAS